MSKIASDNFKSGFVSLIGRPNAGKSTLLNAIVEKKIAITTDVVQTTRHRIKAILNKNNMQAIFVDTPGLHKPKDVLGQELNASVFHALNDVDIVAVLFDASKKIGSGDKWIIDKISKQACHKICVLSKCDLVGDNQKILQLNKLHNLLNWDAIVCLSSVKKYNIDAFIEEIYNFLPAGPAWYSKNEITDQSTENMICEYIREKTISNVYDEIPHSIGVLIDDYYFDNKKKIYKIYANIYVEKDSQKGILLGKDGATIKKIGIEARHDLEKLLDSKVFLELIVKLKKNWRKDYNQVRRFGYTSE